VNNVLYWAAGAAWGLALGLFYFGGLWYTLTRMPGKTRPRAWLAVSFAVRTAVAMAGFYAALKVHMGVLATAMACFLAARIWLTRRLGVEREASCARKP
jgi:F1F0 ATPase subunit 2